MGNLRDERIMRELSQRELGEVIGKDQKYISEVELGRIIPGFRNADTLARFLGVPVERIFPCFTRTSRFPGYKDLMYLYSLGYDIGVYEGAIRELTTKEAHNDG
jgi:transcriptional regulator with XRE-family HTH domain